MKSKPYVAFLNQMPVYQVDVELLDYAGVNVPSSAVANVKNRYPTLSKLTFDKQQKLIRVNHLKATVYDAIIKRSYELMMQYFIGVVNAVIAGGTYVQQIIGSEHVEYTEREIIAAGNWNGVCRMIAERIIRNLESKRDTQQLIGAVNKRLELGIAKKVFDEVAMYIEVRHLLVHNSGKADQNFRAKYGQKVSIGKTGEIGINYHFVQSALRKMHALVATYDLALINKGVIPLTHQQP